MGFFRTIHIPQTVMLPRTTNAHTVMPSGEEKLKICTKCGAEIQENKKFCAECGTSTVRRYSFTLPGTQRILAVQLAPFLSQWLAENPYVYDVELSCDLHHLPIDLSRLNQISATNVTLTYSLSQTPMDIQYGVEFVYTYIATLNYQDILNAKGENAVKMWQAANPNLRYRSYVGGHVKSSDGTFEQYALLVYSAPVAPQNPVIANRPKPEVKFCRHCGAKLTTNGAFCSQCGQKI